MGKGWAIAVHGGAGVDPNLPQERQEEAKQLLTHCLQLGISALRSSQSALDVVELVVRELELDPIFNSGRGSALTAEGTVEMEASIMDGVGRRCGAVSGLSTVKSPVSLARLVMEKSPHSYLAFNGAEEFAKQQEVDMVEKSFFITEDNVAMLKLAKEANSILLDYRVPLTDSCHVSARHIVEQMNGLPINVYTPETVGCVAVDGLGRCASATSTGGLMNKKNGRIGDSPLIGSGTYACKLCGVSCTGEGEAIIRSTLAREVAAVMEYKGLKLQSAVDYVVKERLDEGKAGLIAVSDEGEVEINLLLRKPPSPSTTSLSSNPHAFALTRLFSSPSVKRTHSLPVTPFSNPTAVQTLPETHVVDLSNCDKPQLHNHIKRSLSVPGNVKERSLVKRSESFGTMIRVIPVTPRPIIAEGETVANASTEITIEEEDGEDIPEEEAVCRICFDELAEGGETLKMACSCRGELALAHQECAVKWFSIKGNKICDVCKQDVQNLSVTLLKIQNPQFGRRRRNGIQQQGEIIQPVFWQDIPVLVLVSMLAYFCLLEQLLIGDMGRRALALSFPFACVLAVLSSMIAASMVNRNYIWAFASFQFAVLILFAHIFYTVLQMGAVLAVLLSSFTGFGLAISACSLLTEFWRWTSR